jgi:hypothetical protein
VEVENFSHRDRIRYYRHIELQMPTADQLRVILGRLRELFLSHGDVLQETVSIRLEKIVAPTPSSASMPVSTPRTTSTSSPSPRTSTCA